MRKKVLEEGSVSLHAMNDNIVMTKPNMSKNLIRHSFFVVF